MQSVQTTLPWSLEYVPPPADFFLGSPPKQTTPDIESGLCSPNNQEVFLTASMAFLQNRLMQKLKTDIDSHLLKKKTDALRKYSDLLLVEKVSQHRHEKYFIKLKNIERHDEILKNEARTPRHALSLEQILPEPKRDEWVKPVTFLRLFKTISKTTVVPRASRSSFLEIFKRGGFGKNGSKASSIVGGSGSQQPKMAVSTVHLCQSYVDTLPNARSFTKLDNSGWDLHSVASSISLMAVNRLKMAPSFINPCKLAPTLDTTQISQLPRLEPDLVVGSPTIQRPDEPELPNLSQKPSQIINLITEQPKNKPWNNKICQIRQTRTSFVDETSGGYCSTTSYETVEFESHDNAVDVLTRCNGKTKLRREQSKLSIYLEEDLVSDDELGLGRRSYSSGTDELKTKGSSNNFRLIIRHFKNKCKET